jgi:hypothetical protein
VRNGQLEANGRLFTVNSLNFVESERSFPDIKATLSVSAFVYGTGAPQPPAPPAPQPAPPAPAQPAPAQPQPPAAAAANSTPGA